MLYLNSLFAIRNTNTVPTKLHFLLITAHPDDECMFFSPTIASLLANGNKVSLLCLSSGDSEGIGKVRSDEIQKSGKLMGIDTVHVLEHADLKDSIRETWDSEIIGKQVLQYIKQHKEETYDAFVTFDQYGVSGHKNHTSILPGLRYYNGSIAQKQKLPKLPIWTLLSTSLVRKYSGILDAMPSLVLVTFRVALAPGKGAKKKAGFMLFMSDPMQAAKGQQAMIFGHKSQMRWFRWFWIVIGRYMYVNELKKVA